MNLFDMMQATNGNDQGIKGVAFAVVTNNQDSEGLGRIKVKYPWRDDQDESYWARVTTFMAGNEMGGYFLPEVNDEVLVAFENGDIDHPVIIGGMWSGKMKPPETNSDGKNNRRLIKSRSGHLVILDDKSGNEKIEIIDKTGKNLITIDTAANKITLTSEKDIEIKAPKGKVSIEAMEFQLKSQAAAKIEAGANMDIKTNAVMTVQGSLVKIN